MKKLITLLLVLTGYVGTVSATNNITVYFCPGWTSLDKGWANGSSVFALYVWKDGGSETFLKFQEMCYTQSGNNSDTRKIYGVTFDRDTYDKMIFCRMKSGTADNEIGWGKKEYQSNDADIPETGDLFYDITGWQQNSDQFTMSAALKDFSVVVAGNKQIVTNNEDFIAASTNNVMTSNHDFTYTFTVEDQLIAQGSYGYKNVFRSSGASIEWWCGEGSGDNHPLSISQLGFYDITYTFNFQTGAVTNVATRNSNKTATFYLVQHNGEDYLDYHSNAMMVVGHYAYLSKKMNLTNGTAIGFKVVKSVQEGEQTPSEDWSWDGTSGAGDGKFLYTPSVTGEYIVTYIYDIDAQTSSVEVAEATNNFYYIGGSTSGNSWALGSQLTETGTDTGIFEITLTGDGTNEYTFAIAPDYALSGSEGSYNVPDSDNKWALLFHPRSATTISAFEVSEGECKQANSGDNWTMSFNGNVTFRYNSNDNTWTVVPYRTATIGSAEYITYSNGEKCTVSGAEKIYVITNNNTNTVHAEEMDASTVWPANEGMILKGSNGTNVTIKAVASDATATTIGTNYLVGSGNSTASITAGDGIYIFWWDGSNASSVGFYKANNGTLGAHKAYLNLGRDSFNAHEFLAFDFGDEGDTTGIQQLDAMNHHVDGYFNLAGQRVAQPTKGLYIVNGKKVVIK